MATSTPTNPPKTPVKQLGYAYPFCKKAQGNGAPANFTDEHEFHKLLKKEPSGSYAASGNGLWHGGFHISAAGAGSALDLKHGVRCMADGEVVAWRVNRKYLVSELPAHGDRPAIQASYSTGFALVRHSMEFPKDNKLTFFSLYMHLQDLASYERDLTLPRPPYWSPDFKVTQFPQDKPTAGPGPSLPGQVGLRVRATHPHGTPLCILPHGAQVTISKREGNWGQIADTHGAQLIPARTGGFVEATAAINGWVFLGKESGHAVVEEIMPDALLDRVVVPARPFPIKAGDLIGHLGRYDSLSTAAENRMVHIEMFCSDGIKAFIETGRSWVRGNGHKQKSWEQLGLPSEPTILRIGKNTRLYKEAFHEGRDAPVTDVIQVLSFAELAKHPENKRIETTPGSGDGEKLPWWRIDSADVHGHDISGWVRQENFAGGRVTREFAQSWIDFDASFEDAHDPAHSMFATTKAYVDYHIGADVPEHEALAKLSPLMGKVYRAIYPRGDGSQAADQMRVADDDPWRALRLSRLIIKHDSEWANPAKWKQLIEAIERETGPKPQHEEEQKRIEKLVWWDDVKAGVSDLPGSDVFHVHPIGLLGNFCGEPQSITLEMLAAVDPHGTKAYHEEILPSLNKYAKGYAVITPKRIAHFLSQIAVESGFKNIEEDLKYSPKRMKEIFGCKPAPHGSHTPKFGVVGNEIVCNFCQLRSKLWTDTDYYANNAEHLGSYVYEGRYGNGPEATGDGYKYRGRGLIQTTFRDNYETFKKEHNSRFPQDQRDFVAEPELLLSNLEYGVESAFVYWTVTRNVNSTADNGDVLSVTLKVNGGTHGLRERRAAYNRVATLLGISTETV
ncbi:glycoside hydrolase family 19 protein [Cupriavidus sp. AcVe19-6a]|uniref:glycoside hydrolase family 19 protein n=1 Tax=Cupriavidus sp. AcVe19-6a TaxID=2821358 RepID=UPI001AEA80E9|nr:glycoside hydrolase family 19 protein [Cupriavidus sp. AcVe19-6a]MBP0634210.1 glycoside hydrolase family 19 protein [Cupriavidus sp. AcVe19-6a]